MTPDEQGQQLELFQLTGQTPPRPHREMLGRVMFHLRSDQLVLGGIGGLIAIAIIFAFGVERGKVLVRGERMMLSRQQMAESPASSMKTTGSPAPGASGMASRTPSTSPVLTAPKPLKSGSPMKPVKPLKVAPKAPSEAPKPKVRTKVASDASGESRSRYAIQVVTYTQPQLAKKELARLQARGEQAYLVMREGRTTVYVGPFPSKVNASSKMANLRSRYQDCFMRTL